MWDPILLEELNDLIAKSVSQMDRPVRDLWDLVRLDLPVKWQLPPWGDEGGGFWVVAIFGQQAVWYNDIEDGFNVSRYSTCGLLDEYWCSHDELHHALYRTCERILRP
jgi:hypothetical protein